VHEKLKVVILFSGDIGFYSGWSKVRICLQEALQKGILHWNLAKHSGHFFHSDDGTQPVA